MTNHSEAAGAPGTEQVTLRNPAELAEALPYLLGFRPEDSIVLVALHRGRFGGRVRIGIPERPGDWPSVADEMARCLVSGCKRREGIPDGIVAFLCRDPKAHETGRQTMEYLRPLAQSLRTACGGLDVPVVETLCIADDHFWSYSCPVAECCPPDGTPLAASGTSVTAAAMTYAGIQVRRPLRETRARLTPWQTAAVAEQERALDAAAMALVPRILSGAPRAEIAGETLDLAQRVWRRFGHAPAGGDTLETDLRDDEQLAHDEAARLILGLQDRLTRDHAAEWMEGDEAPLALRLWRALARRCVGPYGEHAAAPLTLAGWVAWSLGDRVEAGEALDMALEADPRYVFARLLMEACSADLDPELVRRSLRKSREDRILAASEAGSEGGGDADVHGDGDGSGVGVRSGAGGVAEVAVGPEGGSAAGQAGAEESEKSDESEESEDSRDSSEARMMRALEAALRRRGPRRSGAGKGPAQAGAHATRRPQGRRRVGRQGSRRDG
ncbi:DUF4192 domain-containing protein [Streptomyces sp. NPDC058067]|uniref:DUF4192 domain-containing protein n=1 Tax=Streptomyces sp. NPDC058067 TaxID=3346324 RepID=UPI0036E90E20